MLPYDEDQIQSLGCNPSREHSTITSAPQAGLELVCNSILAWLQNQVAYPLLTPYQGSLQSQWTLQATFPTN